MRYIKVILFILLASATFTVSAQANADTANLKHDVRAKVETVKGHTALVLKAGRNKTIDLKIEADTWRQRDSIVAGSWGSAVKLKDVNGNLVDVTKASVNSSVGLMFTSGSKCVALKKEELDVLKQ